MKHNVVFTVPKSQLLAQDIRFIVKRGKVKFGELEVSNGTIEWVHGKSKHLLSWRKFAELMKTVGKKHRKGKPQRTAYKKHKR